MIYDCALQLGKAAAILVASEALVLYHLPTTKLNDVTYQNTVILLCTAMRTTISRVRSPAPLMTS
jgi:hypothetical protein